MRLRLGVLLWLASWIPVGVIFGVRAPALQVVWGVQVAIGIAGLALAGTEFAGAVKTSGWRRAPGVAWHGLRGAKPAQDPEPSAGSQPAES